MNFMDGDTFEAHWPEIAAFLDRLLETKSRKRFRALEVHEMASGELIAEVLNTGHGLVVCMRTAIDDAEDDHQDKRWNAEPLTGDPAQRFVVTPRLGASGKVLLGADFLIGCMEAGKRQTTVRAGTAMLRRVQTAG